MNTSTRSNGPPSSTPRGRYLATLTLAAMGVVYGDIGTSPLYAMREAFHGPNAIALLRENVLGVLSLITWSLVIVISIKYLAFVLRADNRGEGGILALMALTRPERITHRRRRWFVVALGLIGAALMYGDGMITPAISVLGAFEGLEVATPVLKPYIVPLTIGVLAGLFMFQRRGTAGVGAVFGPVVLVWFATLSFLGVLQIVREPGVLAALNPLHGAAFFGRNGFQGFLVLGAVFLVVTGGEALYADMGHFGARPIRLGWFAVALPSLLINYFGQGALLIRQPEAVVNPFFNLAPRWALPLVIVIATSAAIIASQAVISGAFSLTRQAIQLGYSPRMQIDHTSSEEIGQIYLPGVNWGLMIATVALVLGFQSSSNLAAAYGVAVSGEMVLTTILLFIVSREVWGWRLPAVLALTGGLLAVELSFFGANALKIPQGGWFPLAVAAGIYTVMATWKRGREILGRRLLEHSVPLKVLLADLAADPPHRVPGAAVFMVRTPEVTPPALVHNLTHNKVLHEKVVFLSVVTEEIPYVLQSERVNVEALGKGFYGAIVRYGFMQDPNIPFVLSTLKEHGVDIKLEATTFFLGRETLISTDRPGMTRWREKLFAFLSRNAARATRFFRLPADQVFEVGVQVEL